MTTGPDYDGNTTVALATAVITSQITTIDANIQITTYEDLTQPDPTNNITGNLTITTVILSSDPSVSVNTNPVVSDPTIQIVSTGSEGIDANTGLNQTTLTFAVTKAGVPLDIYAGSVTTYPASTTLTEPLYRYIILRQDLIAPYLHGNAGGDPNVVCNDLYSLMNFACVQISEGLYQTLAPIWGKEEIMEIDVNSANFGSQFFSEIRPIAKMWEAKSIWYGEKVPTEITPEIQGYIVTMMKAFATEIVESEFERRYLAMRGASDFEADTWAIQEDEAEDYTLNPNAPTPFLDALCAAQNLTKATLVTSILAKAATYKSNLATMLANMQTVLAAFNNCNTVWDINIPYEDYLGVSMPVSEAVALGRTVSATDTTRLPQYAIKGNGCYF
jgi:hypothetical protein